MDLASYADLAVELVNTQDASGDALGDLAGLQALLEGRPQLSGRLGHRDLDSVRALRTELRAVFDAASGGDEEEAVERLNSLLIQHPVHPQLTRHGGGDWHVHLNEGGSVPDRFAARAAMGLAVTIVEQGIDRLGVCRAEGCGRVFFDTTAPRSRRHCSDRCARRDGTAAADPPPRPRVTGAVRATVPGHGPGHDHRPGHDHGGTDRPPGKTATRDGGQ